MIVVDHFHVMVASPDRTADSSRFWTPGSSQGQTRFLAAGALLGRVACCAVLREVCQHLRHPWQR